MKTTTPSYYGDTIVAIATPPGYGGVAIVRLSGPRSLAIGRELVRCHDMVFPSHVLRYGWFLDAKGQALDQVLAVAMLAPRTYTGEEVFEIHLHGSPVLCELVIERANDLGARLAQPGEFTQRAFLNGKLDLAQAESVADLIGSRHRAEAKLAASHLEGRFSLAVAEIRTTLLAWLCLLEAEIDFGDEVDGLTAEDNAQRLARILPKIEALLEDSQQGKLAVTGLTTVLVGAPNVGKSSFLNAVIQEERALVTPVAGTTRDRIEVDCTIAGVRLRLVDTAGLRRMTSDAIELLGMEKTREVLRRADLQIFLIDSHQPDFEGMEGEGLEPDLIILNKSDLVSTLSIDEIQQLFEGVPVRRCELLSEDGREQAVHYLLEVARARLGENVGECFSLNARHREGLLRAREALKAMSLTLEAGLGAEFLALDLRAGAQALGEILGLDITEEVLDRIFGQFCLGK